MDNKKTLDKLANKQSECICEGVLCYCGDTLQLGPKAAATESKTNGNCKYLKLKATRERDLQLNNVVDDNFLRVEKKFCNLLPLSAQRSEGGSGLQTKFDIPQFAAVENPEEDNQRI